MVLYYITLNTAAEARQISRDLLAQKLAVCTNWFPITCAYSWDGAVTEEPETVLIVKTRAGYRSEIEAVVQQHITYTNCMAEITPSAANPGFLQWLEAVVPDKHPAN